MSDTTKPPFTPAQQAAITHGGGGLLVSAAAGSGKTSVLAERCAHVICDAADPCTAAELLVVTFTEAAAAEMKARIGRSLAARRAADPDDDRLAKQVATLDRASISTLHGFCARLLRQHFHLLGLDPAFGILDADEAALLKREVAADLFAGRYDDDGEVGRAFRALVDQYADGADDRLIGEVLGAYESLCSVVDRTGWATAALARLSGAAERPLGESQLGTAYLNDLRRELAGVQRECAAAGAFVEGLGGFDGYVAHLREAHTVVKHLLDTLNTHGSDALAEVAEGVALPKLKPVPNGTPDKDVAKARVDAVNKAIKDGPWRQRLRFTADQWQAGVRATLPHAATLLSLIDAFGAAYAAAKDDQGRLDFNDLERKTLDVLRDAAGRPTAVARQYHATFRHVMVDEFQDINEVQDAILTLLSTECLGRPGRSNLFCVGDVKQSIYRFRLADPARFLARLEAYRDPDRGTVVDLQQNFRSRPPLLEAVNAVFARLMTGKATEVDYDESQRLVAGAKFPAATDAAFAGSPIELHLVSRGGAATPVDGDADESADLDRVQREAVVVGQRVLQVVGRRTVVDRDGTVRPARFGDCVVLLRSMRFKADTVAAQLRAMGVPVHSESNTGYFEATEVNDVLSLLHVLDNARQDVPLAAVLRGPLAGLPSPEDALARIRLAYPPDADGVVVPFHEAVRRYSDEHDDDVATGLRAARARLDRWRQAARDRPVAELVWAVYEETGHLAFCGGLTGGAQRQANLLELHDRARQFGDFRRQGLTRFVGFLEKLRAESDLGQAAVANEADNAVRVMSIHRSKGLEFPVVFVPDLGKQFNLADLNGSVLFDRTLGLGLKVVDPDQHVRYPSLAWTVVRQALRRQVLAEELRVLYVALTRAKEHLVLVGTGGAADVDRWCQEWAGHDGPIPAEAVLAARTPLDWLGPVAAAAGPAHLELTVHDADRVAGWAAGQATPVAVADDHADLAACRPLAEPPVATADAAAAVSRLRHQYPFERLTKVPAAGAVTSLAPHAAGSAQPPGPTVPPPSPELDRPKFLSIPARSASATDRGTATHVVLEHLDFAAVRTEEDVRALVGRLTTGGRLTDNLAGEVDVKAIVWLLESELGGRLRAAAAGLRREVPVYFLEATGNPVAAGVATGPMDQVMARGRLDLLVPEGGDWAIVDYKTDRVDGPAIDGRVATYAPQLRLYADAIRRITKRRVTRATLVFLTPRQLRTVPLADSAAAVGLPPSDR